MRLLAPLLGAAGMVAAYLAWAALVEVIPPAPGASSMAVRLGTACAALLPAAAVLLAMTVAQFTGRYVTGAFDPTLGRDGRFLIVNQRVIANSVEQMAIFTPALLALAAGVEARLMPQVVALALVFAAARLLFWVSYLANPLIRGPGMGAGFAVNFAAVGGAIWAWMT